MKAFLMIIGALCVFAVVAMLLLAVAHWAGEHRDRRRRARTVEAYERGRLDVGRYLADAHNWFSGWPHADLALKVLGDILVQGHGLDPNSFRETFRHKLLEREAADKTKALAAAATSAGLKPAGTPSAAPAKVDHQTKTRRRDRS